MAIPHLIVKPYPNKTQGGLGNLFRGNIEYYFQRWEYDGDMTIEEFFEAFRNPIHVQELLSTKCQRVIYDNWGDNVDSWMLYNLKKTDFYWDAEGFCLFDLFKFAYSYVQGHFQGYWYEADLAINAFKQYCEIQPTDQMTYYSTIWGGECPTAPRLFSDPLKYRSTPNGERLSPNDEECKKVNLDAIVGRTLHNAPLTAFSEYTGKRYNPERFLYKRISKWFLDWDDEWFEVETGRNDLSIFHNHTQKTFMIMALRESEFLLSALRDKGL